MRKKTQIDTGDGFLARWSEKKRQSEHPLEPATDSAHKDESGEERLSQNTSESADRPGCEDQGKNQDVLVDEDMPDIETLDHQSDYSGFLSPGVSDELRKLALRRLFRGKAFNVRDGLDDYDDDFRSFAGLGGLITSDMKHQMEMAEQKQEQTTAPQEDQAIADETGEISDPIAEQSDVPSASDPDSLQEDGSSSALDHPVEEEDPETGKQVAQDDGPVADPASGQGKTAV